ncbi:MAG: bifunctional (p)ppGpp synthetase/guanosine-3',5'-bis(diphosphate) 3'-pyrophosphohydrolase [Thaumarchaeota archaeon]|nr:bifunctional (p)ppGpp synthetase/guanosine-3',5'-bis(diphosphate) 3'-pyrophosphohydrolase [Nitrososphaerota archaeon]
MATLVECEAYARGKGADIPFCMGVVFRLKSIGITHEQILCSAILSQTKSTFDELFERFGRDVAVMATSIMRDNTKPKKKQEESYVEQIQQAPWESVLIKLCEISANLKVIKESELSKNKRRKLLKQNIHYLNVLKKNIAENQDKALGLAKLLDGANETIMHFGHRPIKFE